jgi:hypothetical protein
MTLLKQGKIRGNSTTGKESKLNFKKDANVIH